MPPPKTPQEIILDVNKKRLGAALGIDGNLLPSTAFNRIVDLATSGTANDVTTLLKAKSVIGNEAWDDVSRAVLGRMGLGRDMIGFTDAWKAMPENGKRALLGGSELKSALDDFVRVFDKVTPLQRLANPTLKAVRSTLETVPLIGPMLATKLGNTAAHSVGLMTEPVSAGTVAATAFAASKYMARPRSVQKLTRWLNAYEALGENSKAVATTFSLASRMLAKDIADETNGDEAKIAAALDVVKDAR